MVPFMARAFFIFTLCLVSLAAKAGDAQCAAVLCLSSDSSGVPATCYAKRQPYFAIKVFNPLFDPISTATLRDTWLRKCFYAESSDLARIKKTYGPQFLDPRV